MSAYAPTPAEGAPEPFVWLNGALTPLSPLSQRNQTIAAASLQGVEK